MIFPHPLILIVLYRFPPMLDCAESNRWKEQGRFVVLSSWAVSCTVQILGKRTLGILRYRSHVPTILIPIPGPSFSPLCKSFVDFVCVLCFAAIPSCRS